MNAQKLPELKSVSALRAIANDRWIAQQINIINGQADQAVHRYVIDKTDGVNRPYDQLKAIIVKAGLPVEDTGTQLIIRWDDLSAVEG